MRARQKAVCTPGDMTVANLAKQRRAKNEKKNALCGAQRGHPTLAMPSLLRNGTYFQDMGGGGYGKPIAQALR